jgi:hypothetical protein
LRAVEQMDPAESATILALPVVGTEEPEGGEASDMVDEQVTGAA